MPVLLLLLLLLVVVVVVQPLLLCCCAAITDAVDWVVCNVAGLGRCQHMGRVLAVRQALLAVIAVLAQRRPP
jgi:hypothetical protein